MSMDLQDFLPPPWVAEASCASPAARPAWFWNRVEFEKGKQICYHCPVREQCLNVALLRKEESGLWGGYSPSQRRKILRGEDPGPVWVPPGDRTPQETERERGVRERISEAHRMRAEGRTRDEIGDALGRSKWTVRKYLLQPDPGPVVESDE